ncbi:hypothetical protein [Escherichia coli]|uniref:Uncharacterized protein n=4 Tax=Asteriusvirus TaxID=2560094 RepID=A0A5A4U5J0_9CAUD|nr:hypothetical protein [Escherichia coli]YP_009101784.1 hypothetical protein PBI_121Q_197 [Escherichia phage 121Q]YP_009150641.1 hypothetical protein ACQ29_gp327 [Escherichia phage PBECO4]AXC36585.1 hypothetical protein [Escherichia phage UB]MED6924271.1 hypothetical protein [Escherichia coli O157]WIL01053.1 hypothetical protein [Escherichia phage vB_EcoM_CRJP21]WPK19231.1 hypothetical protein [Salmonella phage SD-6_S16]WPK19904.1 hypothetical protein [Salmonella phage SD-1_S14]WPK20924.1 
MNRKGRFKVSKKNKSSRFKPIVLTVKSNKDLTALSKKIISSKIEVSYVNSLKYMNVKPLDQLISLIFERNDFEISVDDYRAYNAGFINVTCNKKLTELENLSCIINLDKGVVKYHFVHFTNINNGMGVQSRPIVPTCDVTKLAKLNDEEYFQESIVTEHLDDIIATYKECIWVLNAIKPKLCLMNIVRDL